MPGQSTVRRWNAHSAPVLLAVFLVGGLAGPALHRLYEAAARAAAQREQRTASHHHHTPTDGHGDEWTQHCPVDVADDRVCVLCEGLSVQLLVGDTGAVDPPPHYGGFVPAADAAPSHAVTVPLSRGPPTA